MYGLRNLRGVLQDEFLQFVDMFRSYLGWVLKGEIGKQTFHYPTLRPVISRPYYIVSPLWHWHSSHIWLGNLRGVLQDEFSEFINMYRNYLGWVLKDVVSKQTLQYPTLRPVISRLYHILSPLWHWHSSRIWLGKTRKEFFKMSS